MTPSLLSSISPIHILLSVLAVQRRCLWSRRPPLSTAPMRPLSAHPVYQWRRAHPRYQWRGWDHCRISTLSQPSIGPFMDEMARSNHATVGATQPPLRLRPCWCQTPSPSEGSWIRSTSHISEATSNTGSHFVRVLIVEGLIYLVLRLRDTNKIGPIFEGDILDFFSILLENTEVYIWKIMYCTQFFCKIEFIAPKMVIIYERNIFHPHICGTRWIQQNKTVQTRAVVGFRLSSIMSQTNPEWRPE